MNEQDIFTEQPQGPRSRLGQLRNGNTPCDLSQLPRCAATAKSTGRRCGNPAMKGKRVCFIHGGRSPGAPKNNRHALKTGQHTAQAKAEQAACRSMLKTWNRFLDNLDTSHSGVNGAGLMDT